METKINELTELLLEKNDKLSFEYKGAAVTEMVIKKWIDGYGEQLHEFAGTNEKYKHLLETD